MNNKEFAKAVRDALAEHKEDVFDNQVAKHGSHEGHTRFGEYLDSLSNTELLEILTGEYIED